MGALEYLIKFAVDSAPHHPGFQTHPVYLFLNLTLPLFLGLVLAWVTRLMEKGLNRLMGEKR